MSNPFEDLEYLSDFLPEEGESVLMTRKRGQLICEPFFEPVAVSSEPSGKIDRDLFGRMTTINTRLKNLAVAPILVSILSYYWLCVVMHRLFSLGWAGWYLDFGLGLLIGISCFLYIQFRQRRYFVEVVCPLMQQLMLERQLEKYSLIAYLSQHRSLSVLASAFSRWT